MKKPEKPEIPDGIVDPDALPPHFAKAVLSATLFLLNLSDHAGSVIQRSDGSAIFILRDAEATSKFLALYRMVFEDAGEVVPFIRSQENMDGDSEGDSEGGDNAAVDDDDDEDNFTDLESN